MSSRSPPANSNRPEHSLPADLPEFPVYIGAPDLPRSLLAIPAYAASPRAIPACPARMSCWWRSSTAMKSPAPPCIAELLRQNFTATMRPADPGLRQYRRLHPLRPRQPARLALCRRGSEPGLGRYTALRRPPLTGARPRARNLPDHRYCGHSARPAFHALALRPAVPLRPDPRGPGPRAEAAPPPHWWSPIRAMPAANG